MKIDFSKTLVDLKGEPMRRGPETDSPAITLGEICVNALLATFQDEAALSGVDKFARYELADRVTKNTLGTDYSAEDIALIKKLIGKGWGPLTVGASWKILEGKDGYAA